ncbi:splicing factor, suppressor of white-apricot homolog [Corythoichthys intestinalis]|uniref:splicing factor, suppressor of white-apricot homolog n=1 Tax=Corythoichthys intestinalis TaxID=161448 RepID=UPI0025A62964|nr:splicing factor, suppressor of white-apricot homolog [Corythoichthys intestinalis]XP_061800806.1 splicing factor, suppressor of white-apricot homolog [Nerophis lumbriciformis]
MYRRGTATKDANNKPASDASDSEKYADLLVFGYACKVFRDDERALYHEHGKHLIPWMGDKSIMIDRYDGRGHLHDLSEYDSGSWNTSYQLSEEEARIEALCDEERYLAFHTDLLEEEARQEEEYKRLSEALADEGTYNAVAFKYTAEYYDPSQPTEEEDANKRTEEPEPEESEEPFVAPQGLEIPSDVELPATIKTHNIIERTATFVCQQGAQFEIVLKAKQSGNSQFDFLRFDHYLNPYYKHILRAMKEGRYNVGSTNKQEQPEESNSDDSDDDGDGNYLHPSLFAPKKSSRLEELMKPLRVMDPDHPLAALVRKAKEEQNGVAAVQTGTEEVSDPVMPSTVTQYTADPNASAVYYGYYMLPDGTYCVAPPPPGVDATSYYSSVPSAGITSTTVSGAFPHSVTSTASGNIAIAPAGVSIAGISNFKAEAPVVTAAAAAPAIIPPPLDIQAVIDKLAEYVVRNGLKFEASVRAKNDPRFDFLQSWHQYNTYYEYKKNYFMQKEGKSFPEMAEGGTIHLDESGSDSRMNKASFAPICFAIKPKENELLPLEKNRVRLDDDSDEDKLLEGDRLQAVVGDGAELAEKEPQPVSVPEEKRLSLQEMEAKQAKQKLEDRLAAAAREKLAQASKESKEKQLQAERKRKAALFLQTLRNPLMGEPEAKRVELDLSTQLEMQKAISVLSDLPLAQTSSSTSAYLREERSHSESRRSRQSREESSSSHYSPSRGGDRNSKKGRYRDSDRDRRRDREYENDRNRDKERDKDKKKKKHKRRSRSRSRSTSRPKSKHLSSAYRRSHRSRSRSHSPRRRGREGPSSERRHDVKDHGSYHHSSSSGFRRDHSTSRSPLGKRKSSISGTKKTSGSSVSPDPSPNRALSPSSSPSSSLAQSRGASQEKEPVSSSIVSAVQSKITQDLMAKVRAMLASSKAFQPPTS